ncbi:uncharacterized protein [Nicotiana tomentosiformis]|uniref:uncharacterized protein n=1 Tax=Nicotiana tomentosiformis TaxID=4098 RepID=UPI00388C35F6
MHRVRSQDRLKGFDPKPERTFHRRLREARDTNNLQALVQFLVNMAEEKHMDVQEVAMPSIANVTSSIMKPRITGHFELKQSMIQLLHANGQFMGLPHEDPQQHILNFLEISDTYITNGVNPDYKAGKSLYSAWERFKGLLRDCPHHNQTNEVLSHTFIEGLHPETKIVVDAATGGQVLEKSFDEIYALLNKFSKSNPNWQTHGVKICRDSRVRFRLGIISAYFYTDQPSQSDDLASPSRSNEKFGAPIGIACSAQNTRPVGALPSDTEANPKASINAVSLRNKRQLEEVQSKKRKQVTFNEKPTTIESESEKSKESEKLDEEAVAKQLPPLVARPPPLFPQRLQKVKDNAAYKKFLDILKQVQINIPLVDILQEVTKYAKYIKDIVANKRRLTEFETVALTEECSFRIQSKLPQKLKDPGSFTIQISIGKHAVGRALCDLGASINLMPLSVFR